LLKDQASFSGTNPINDSRGNQSDFLLRNVFRFLAEADWWLIGATVTLLTIGLTTLKYSQQGMSYFDKQLDFALVGIFAALVFWRLPYYYFLHKLVIPTIYGVNLALLLAVMLKGHSALGAQRWLSLGPITLQPSELAKLVVIFTMAAWFATRPIKSFFDIFKILAIIAPPALLIFKQPDLGTSLAFGAIFLGMSYWAGATSIDILVLLSPVISLILNAVDLQYWKWYLIGLGGTLFLFWRRKNWSWWMRLILALAVVGANFACGEVREHMWGLLKEYQQKRLTSFVNPYSDPRGSGYHILQSLIAIGSGGISGYGLGKGNQSQGAFIPERHTDFIFAVVGEELGFKITVLVIIAYAVLCYRALIIAYNAREEPGGSFIAIGIMSLFLFHVFLNIGMTIGIMPVAGVPLPFLSYGGTAIIVDLVAIGILQSIRTLNPPPKKDVWR
jgi:rod shape determining protein RodA